VEFMKVVNLNDSLATPVLKMLDLYFCLWECYVVKSAEKIRLEEEQRQLQASNDLLASDSDILLQLCKLQYCGNASERFRLFVMVLFQPWRRAIFKPAPPRSLRVGKVSMW
jgi:hypothetical protein